MSASGLCPLRGLIVVGDTSFAWLMAVSVSPQPRGVWELFHASPHEDYTKQNFDISRYTLNSRTEVSAVECSRIIFFSVVLHSWVTLRVTLHEVLRSWISSQEFQAFRRPPLALIAAVVI